MPDSENLHRALADPSRRHLLDVLRAASGALDVGHLAEVVGLHVSTVRGHMAVLVEAGLVSAAPQSTGGPGRPRMGYSATEAATLSTDTGYRLLAMIALSQLAELQPGAAAALGSGRRWGAHLIGNPRPGTSTDRESALATISELMDELGFAPDRPDDSTMVLRRCPFADLARDNQDLVCTTHLGIVRGALSAMGADLEATELRPFADDGTVCTVHFSDPK